MLSDDLIWIDPDRLSGIPCFKGTRVPVQALIDHLDGNSNLDEFHLGFPSVTREQAIQFIELAKGNLLECVNARVRVAFPGHSVTTVTEAG
jgi:uncharacterized protein (DUF433 family)